MGVCLHDVTLFSQPASTKKISIQGILKDGDGAAVADGNYSLTFSLYASATGGSPVWSETQSTVRVRSGVYSALLGSVNAFTGGTAPSNAIFDVAYFLGVKVNGGNELTPRTELSYSPYALAVNNAATSTLAAKASTLAHKGGNGTGMTFHWEGQPGQPTWLWGGNEVNNHYVWNPSNFSVNHAATAGSAPADGGNSNTVAGLAVHGGRNNESNKIVRTDANGYLNAGYINSNGGNEGNNSSPARVWGTNGSDDFLRSYLTSALVAGNVSTTADVVVNSIKVPGNGRPDYSPYTVGHASAYFNVSGILGAGGGHAFNNGLAIVTGGNMGASHYFAFSDERIKMDIKSTDAEYDLAALTQLEVVDYRYKDYLDKGYELNKGFIAQQVKSIFPEAITVQTDAIPDIYAMSLSIDHTQNESTITMEKDHQLEVGDRVKLMLDKGEEFYVVKTCHAPNQFGIEGLSPELKNVFVFGREVNDFLSVDYDRIYTLGISVIQQLVKRVSALEKENNALRTEQSDMKNMMQSMASRLDALEKTSVHVISGDAKGTSGQ